MKILTIVLMEFRKIEGVVLDPRNGILFFGDRLVKLSPFSRYALSIVLFSYKLLALASEGRREFSIPLELYQIRREVLRTVTQVPGDAVLNQGRGS